MEHYISGEGPGEILGPYRPIATDNDGRGRIAPALGESAGFEISIVMFD